MKNLIPKLKSKDLGKRVETTIERPKIDDKTKERLRSKSSISGSGNSFLEFSEMSVALSSAKSSSESSSHSQSGSRSQSRSKSKSQTIVPVPDPIPDPSPVTVKKRGRPKKVKPEDEYENDAKELQSNVDNIISRPPSPKPVPAPTSTTKKNAKSRGRGRPKKSTNNNGGAANSNEDSSIDERTTSEFIHANLDGYDKVDVKDYSKISPGSRINHINASGVLIGQDYVWRVLDGQKNSDGYHCPVLVLSYIPESEYTSAMGTVTYRAKTINMKGIFIDRKYKEQVSSDKSVLKKQLSLLESELDAMRKQLVEESRHRINLSKYLSEKNPDIITYMDKKQRTHHSKRSASGSESESGSHRK
jgi:hypothetical protein